MRKQVLERGAFRAGWLLKLHGSFFHGQHHAVGCDQLGHRCHRELAGGIPHRFLHFAAVQQGSGHRIRGPLANLAKFTHTL